MPHTEKHKKEGYIKKAKARKAMPKLSPVSKKLTAKSEMKIGQANLATRRKQASAKTKGFMQRAAAPYISAYKSYVGAYGKAKTAMSRMAPKPKSKNAGVSSENLVTKPVTPSKQSNSYPTMKKKAPVAGVSSENLVTPKKASLVDAADGGMKKNKKAEDTARKNANTEKSAAMENAYKKPPIEASEGAISRTPPRVTSKKRSNTEDSAASEDANINVSHGGKTQNKVNVSKQRYNPMVKFSKQPPMDSNQKERMAGRPPLNPTKTTKSDSGIMERFNRGVSKIVGSYSVEDGMEGFDLKTKKYKDGKRVY